MLARSRSLAVIGLSLAGTVACAGESTSRGPQGGARDGKGGTTGGAGSAGGTSAASSSSGSGAVTQGGEGGTVVREPSSCNAADVVRVATTNLGNVLRKTVARSAFVEGSGLVTRALSGGDNREPLRFAESATKKLDELIDWLSQKVLAAGNLESGRGTSYEYSLKSAVYCAPDPDELASDPDWAKQQEADCARELAEHPVSFEVVFDACDGDGGERLTVTPSFGAAGAKPFSLNLAPEWLALTVDVAEVARYTAQQGYETKLDGDSSGSLSFMLSTERPDQALLQVGLAGGLGLGWTAGGKHTRLDAAASDRLFYGTADATTRQVSAKLVLGDASLGVSFATFIETLFGRRTTPDVSPNDTVAVDVPGSVLLLDFDRDTDGLSFSRSTLGDSLLATASDASGTLIRADVNEAWSGTTDLELNWEPGGALRVAATPEFSLDLSFWMEKAASQVIDLPSFASDDVVSFALDDPSTDSAAARPSVALLMNDELDLALPHRSPGPQLVVDQGTFVMSSKAAALTTTVEAGTCLVYNPNSQVEHEILRGYEQAACPSVFK